MKRITTALYLVSLLTLLTASVALAAPKAHYIDPNVGGMLFQALAVIFTLLSSLIFFFSSRIKLAFARLKRTVRKKTGRLSEVDETEVDEAAKVSIEMMEASGSASQETTAL